MQLIVNVDDVGLHPATGRAVEILVGKGVVTSASVVVTGMDFEAVSSLNGVGLGVHLDILRGRPISHWQHVNTLVDENGSFLVSPIALFRRYAMGNVEHEQVEMEWRAQIERFMEFGMTPTHLSSHKHVHAWPSLTRMAGELAREYGIKWVRKPEECAEISRLDGVGLQAKFLNVCGLFSRETSGVNWTDVFWGITDSGDELTPEGFVEYMARCGGDDESNVVEMCCCPGMTVAGDPPIPAYCNPTEISAVWRKEYASLNDDDWLSAFEKLGMRLTDFSSIE